MRDFLNAQQFGFELVENQPARQSSGASSPPVSNVRVRGASGLNAPPPVVQPQLPMVPVAIGFLAGTIFGFVLCYLMLRAF
jgi:hypothetical protein